MYMMVQLSLIANFKRNIFKWDGSAVSTKKAVRQQGQAK